MWVMYNDLSVLTVPICTLGKHIPKRWLNKYISHLIQDNKRWSDYKVYNIEEDHSNITNRRTTGRKFSFITPSIPVASSWIWYDSLYTSGRLKLSESSAIRAKVSTFNITGRVCSHWENGLLVLELTLLRSPPGIAGYGEVRQNLIRSKSIPGGVRGQHEGVCNQLITCDICETKNLLTTCFHRVCHQRFISFRITHIISCRIYKLMTTENLSSETVKWGYLY